MKPSRPTNSSQNPGASACTNRNGAPSSNAASVNRAGRNRESHAPKGSDSNAAVIHHTPCSSPACKGVIPKSSRIKGRNNPKVYETRMTLLCWARNKSNTAQPRRGVRSNSAAVPAFTTLAGKT